MLRLNRTRATTLALCLFATALSAPGLDAQGGMEFEFDGATVGGKVTAKRAIKIELSGSMRFDAVLRNDRYFDAALGNAVDGSAAAPLGWDTDPSEGGGDWFLNPWISLNIDTQLADGVNAMFTLETPFDAFQDNVGGSGTGRTLDVDQAYVQWMGAFTPDLTLSVGIRDYSIDFAGNGEPFLLDVGNAESAFGNPGPGAADFGAPMAPSSGLVGTQEAAGFLGELNMGDAELDLFYFTLNETFRADEDETLLGATLTYDFQTDDYEGQVGFVFFDLMNDQSSSVWTWGGGGHLQGYRTGMKFYGEAYGQFGRYVNNLTGFGRIRQARSFALMGGVRYQLPGFQDARPWLDASYTEVSGDDNGDDSKNGNFISLESNDDTIIMESAYYGYDIDTNYRAAKVKAGMNFSEDWSAEGVLAFFELQDNSNGTASNNTSSDKLGEELDLTVYYRATDYLNLSFGTGWLFNANALGVGSNASVTVFTAEIRF